MRSLVRLLLALVAGTLALGLVRDASACGAFAARPTEGQIANKLPFLTVEQVLLVWDAATETEDFVRETRFDKANESFGFVVPTPSKPEVSGVAKAPFDELRKAFPYEDQAPGRGKGAAPTGGGVGAGAAPAVVVLSQERIGSFTAFTLSASDATAFDKWLHDNGFAMSEEAKPWLAHYVALKFFFVAFRYDAKPAQTPSMTSETVRIRFKTPAPYYPYLEPVHAPDSPRASRRMLTGWYVGPKPIAAVAAHGIPSPPQKPWARPWALGARYDTSDEDVKKVLPEDLRKIVPQGKLVVQTFLDQKTSRANWGDVVLVPTGVAVSDKSELEKLRPLLPVVDPNLLLTDAELAQLPDPHFETHVWPEGPPAPMDLATTPPASPPPPKKRGCSVSAPGEDAGGAWMLVAVVVGASLVRRRRLAGLVAILALVSACRKPPPKSEPAPVTSTARPAAKAWWESPHPPGPLTRDERETMALVLLAGGELDKIDDTTSQEAARAPLPQANIVSTNSTVPISDLDRVFAGMRPRFRMCYAKGVESDPAMAGKVTLALKIQPNGEVEAADVAMNTGISADVVKCLVRASRNATFAAPGGVGAHATVTIAFAQ
jgi:MYXO-CTERM domain-containing protein